MDGGSGEGKSGGKRRRQRRRVAGTEESEWRRKTEGECGDGSGREPSPFVGNLVGLDSELRGFIVLGFRLQKTSEFSL